MAAVFEGIDDTAARSGRAGAVFLSYKTLYYELIEAVDGGKHGDDMLRTFGPFPEDLPDTAS